MLPRLPFPEMNGCKDPPPKNAVDQRVPNPVDIPWNTDWLLGILIMAYYNLHITGLHNPFYTAKNLGQLVKEPGGPNPHPFVSHPSLPVEVVIQLHVTHEKTIKKDSYFSIILVA